jgi:hypothetical protein
MKDPVVMKDGQTYEREAITAALQRNPMSPITRQQLNIADAVQNFALKGLIDRVWSKAFPITIRYAKRFGRGQVEVEVRLDDTIESLKSQIVDVTGIPAAQQLFKLEGAVLNDTATIYECGIEESSCIDVEWPKIQVFIKENTTRTMVLNICSLQTGMDVKRVIQEHWGLPPEIQMLVCRGRPVVDRETLLQQKITNDATIYVTGRLLGGVTMN